MENGKNEFSKNKARLQALHEYDALKETHESFFDFVLNMVMCACKTSKGFISVFDNERQVLKARSGFNVNSIPLHVSICASFLDNGEELLEIPDMQESKHSVVGSTVGTVLSSVRFYAGVPLQTPDGTVIGSVAVMDTAPGKLNEEQKQALQDAAASVMAYLEQRRQLQLAKRQRVDQESFHKTAHDRDVLKGLIENLPDFVYVVDRQGRYLLDNAAHRKLLGQEDLEDVAGRRVYEFFSEETARRTTQSDAAVLETNQPLLNAEESFYNQEGTLCEVAVSRVPLRDSAGNVEGVACIGRDISNRKRAEEALEKQRYLLETLMQNMADGIYFKDLQGRFLHVSYALAARFGVEESEDVIGRTDFDFFTEEHAKQAYADEQHIIATGEPIINKEEKETWPNDETTWVSTSKEPLRDRNGKIVGTFGISRDITHIKNARDQLAEHNRRNREEMELAKQIHRSFLPVQVPQYSGLEFGLRFVPSGDIGGDFVEFLNGKNHEFPGVVFADITGHGTGAALLSAMLKVLLDEATDSNISQQECFRYLNRRLYQEYPAGAFASGIYAVFNVQERIMTYVNASQEPIILLREGQKPQLLNESEGALGLLAPGAQEPEYTERVLELCPNDTVFFYTDGLVDYFNDMEKTAEHREQLIQWLEENKDKDPQELVDNIYNRALSYANLSEPTDDVAALAVRFSPDTD